MNKIGWIVVLFIFGGVGLFAQSLADLLSPQTIALATFKDIKSIDAKRLETVWGQFCQLPETKAFVANWNKDFAPTFEFLNVLFQKNTGVRLQEILALLNGEISIALESLEQEPNVVISIDYSGQKSVLTHFLSQMSQGREEIRTLEGNAVTVYNKRLWIYFGETRLLASNSEKTLARLLNQLKSPTENNLSKSALYQKHRTGNELVFLFVNPQIFFAFVPPEVNNVLKALGFSSSDGLSISYGYEGTHLVGRTRLSFQEAPIGIFAPNKSNGIAPESLSHLRGHLVSASACSFSLKAWLSTFQSILTMLPPNALETYREMNQEVKKQIGFTVEELTNLFGETYSSWQFNKNGAIKTLYAIELKSPQGFLSLLPKIEQSPYLQLFKKEYKGTTIYQVGIQTTGGLESAMIAFVANLYLYGSPSNFMIYKNQLIGASLPHVLQDYLDLQGTTGEGPLMNFAEQAQGKQFINLSFHPKNSAESYRNIIHFLKRFETVFRTFGIPTDFGALPRAKTVLSLIKPSMMQVYFQENCLNFEFKIGFPLTFDNTTFALVGVAGVGIGAAIALPTFASARERAQITQCQAQIRQFEMALQMYQIDQGKFPPDGDENLFLYLSGDSSISGSKFVYIDTSFLKKADHLLLDPWGNPYHYQLSFPGFGDPIQADFYLWSNGPNGIDEQGEGDDIVSWRD